MGWGDPIQPATASTRSPAEVAATANLSRSVREFLVHGTTGRREELVAALDRFDRART